MIATLVLLALVAIATFTDLWKHKIYNWTTYTGIVAAVVLAAIADTTTETTGSDQLSMIGLNVSLLGLLTCGAIMMVCYVMFQIGGGDVKLIAMIGAFVGPSTGIEVLLWTFVLGAATAILILIWKCGAIDLAQTVLQQIFSKLNIGKWQPISAEHQARLQMKLYLAPCALLALLVAMYSPLSMSMNQ